MNASSRTLSLIPLLGCLALSCGQMPPGDEPGPGGQALKEQSGARLRRVFLKGSDGTQVAIWFHDTKLGVDCGFQKTEAGWMCLPIGGAVPDAAKYVTASTIIAP